MDNDINFRNLSYTIKSGTLTKCRKQILKRISGTFKSCELTAVMGTSGSGKSTLLNVLSGYSVDNISGSFQINETRTQSYIMQEENLHHELTVRESMKFSINLKIGSCLKSDERRQKIDETLETFGLLDKSESFVRDLSGGQQRRLSIALELVDDPSVLFLDEPTTGLDSSSSTKCIQLLKKLTQKGRTIICTIHAPSAAMLQMFDHLFVLAKGSCIYQGSSGNLLSFLSELDFLCPQSYNPTDFLLEIANEAYGTHNNRLVCKIGNGSNENYRNDEKKLKICQEFEALNVKKKNCFINELSNLTIRNFLILYRDVSMLRQRLLIHLALAICFTIAFHNVGQEAPKILGILRSFYAMSVIVMYTGFYSMAARFNLETATITREYFNRWYSTWSYFLAMTIADIPLTFTCTTLFVGLSYFTTDQPIEGFRFFTVFGFQILLSFTSQGLGLMVGAIFSLMGSLTCATIFVPIFVLLSGFMMMKTDAADSFQWLFDICFLKQAGQASTAVILGYNRKLNCDGAIFCRFRKPAELLNLIGNDTEVTQISLTVVLVSLTLFRLIAFVAIDFRLRSKRLKSFFG